MIMASAPYTSRWGSFVLLKMDCVRVAWGGSLSMLHQGRGLHLERGLCLGGLCPGGSLSQGSLSGVSVPGVSVQGGLCLGVSVWGFCPGGLCPGGLCHGDPPYGTHPTGMHSCCKNIFNLFALYKFYFRIGSHCSSYSY